MERLPIYQIDAFTSRLFAGNPAAVCPLEAWLPDELLQSIAMENNLSETAFLVREAEGYRLRWFTPEFEVDLCGHATLASAYVVFQHLAPHTSIVSFDTKSGTLEVHRNGDELEMDFPAWIPEPLTDGATLEEALGADTVATFRAGPDYAMAVFNSEGQVRALRPDFALMKDLAWVGVVATSLADENALGGVDFVSRFFAPKAGIPEDPVTGSAHCATTPYWAERLGRARLRARQLSKRGGELVCELRGERVAIAGRCAPYLEGTIAVPTLGVH